MTVGVKYCGGCRACYNRGALVKRIAAVLNENIVFEPTAVGKEYEVILVVNGCRTACADCSALKAHRFLAICCEEDAAGISKKLLEIFEGAQ